MCDFSNVSINELSSICIVECSYTSCWHNEGIDHRNPKLFEIGLVSLIWFPPIFPKNYAAGLLIVWLQGWCFHADWIGSFGDNRLDKASPRLRSCHRHARAFARLAARGPGIPQASHVPLWSAIIHQGTPWTATGPAALVVAGLLSDERIDRGEPIRANLLSFLVEVAKAPQEAALGIEELERMAAFDIEPFLDLEDDKALYENEDAADSFYARAIRSTFTTSNR